MFKTFLKQRNICQYVFLKRKIKAGQQAESVWEAKKKKE